MDMEKVIKWLEHDYLPRVGAYRKDCKQGCDACMPMHDGDDYCDIDMLCKILAILKEQEEKIQQLNRYVNGFSKDAACIVRCKDCKHRPKEPDLETYESGFDLEFPEGSKCPCRCCGDEWYSWYPDDDWFCADGVKRDG